MNLQEIKDAVDAGETVYWTNSSYSVIKDSGGQYLIGYAPKSGFQNYIGLTHADGVTLNGYEHQFYIGPGPHPKRPH